jgi:ABC-type transport system substrate-binding protein
MKKSSKNRTIFILILVVGLLVAGCNGTSQDNTSTDVPPVGDVTETDEAPMSMTLSADIHLDPAVVALDDEDSLMVSALVYEGLMRQLNDGSVVPGITSCEPSDDFLSYRCTINTNAYFADVDVTPITADIVAENFNRWHDPAHPLHGSDSDVYQGWKEYFLGFKDEVDAEGKPISLFDGVEKVNDLTILIHLFEPMDDFLEIIASPHFSILNPATLAAEGDSYGTKDGSVVSSGPYKVFEWSDTSLTLTPNDVYWGTQPTADLEYTFE